MMRSAVKNKLFHATAENESDWFKTTAELGQHCPLSLTLFSIVLELNTPESREDHESPVCTGRREVTDCPFQMTMMPG